MVALPVLLLLQVPPVMASFNTDVVSEHNVSVPVIDGGKGLTVTVVVIGHPEPAV